MPLLGEPRGRIYPVLSSRVQSTGCYLSHYFHNSRRKLVLLVGHPLISSLLLRMTEDGVVFLECKAITNAKVTKLSPFIATPLPCLDSPPYPELRRKKKKNQSRSEGRPSVPGRSSLSPGEQFPTRSNLRFEFSVVDFKKSSSTLPQSGITHT